MDQMGNEMVDKIRDMAGHYQPATGPYPSWQRLAQSTIDKKAREGWGRAGNPDSPLWATGKFASTVSFKSIPAHGTIVVGSKLKYMAWQEWGSSKTPPRPIFGPAAEIVVPHYIPKIRAAAITGLIGFNVTRF